MFMYMFFCYFNYYTIKVSTNKHNIQWISVKSASGLEKPVFDVNSTDELYKRTFYNIQPNLQNNTSGSSIIFVDQQGFFFFFLNLLQKGSVILIT